MKIIIFEFLENFFQSRGAISLNRYYFLCANVLALTSSIWPGLLAFSYPAPFDTPLRLCSVLLGLLLIMVCGLGLPLRAFIHHVVLAGGCRYICRGNRWVGELAVDDLTSVKSPGVGG